jgi:hypothetical protein
MQLPEKYMEKFDDSSELRDRSLFMAGVGAEEKRVE